MLKKLKALLQILSDGNYHSETVLSKKFKLTRATIWKRIKQLKKYGIDIEAKTNQGYRIPHSLELLNKNSIIQCLTNQQLINPNNLLIFDELPSTNSYLEELVKINNSTSGILEKYVCIAEYQTQGRGRLGRKWISPFARNIYLSILWQFSSPPCKLSSLGLALAIAIVATLKKYGIKTGLALKWPNDVLWKNQKLAGILIDLFDETNYIHNAVIGIGINVSMPKISGERIDQPWCDIATITNSIPQRNKLSGMLLNELLTTITDYQNHGLKPFIKKWQKLDVTYNKKVTIITPKQQIVGTSLGINDQGYFLLKDPLGQTHTFASGEVSLRLQNHKIVPKS